MKSQTLRKISLAISLALLTSTAIATDTTFDEFTPMTGDVGAGTLPEAAPYRLSSSRFTQISIVARGDTSNEVPNTPARFDSGNYDMHTANETGPDVGRFLFTVFETAQAGIQRTDLRSMITTTIWQSPGVGEHVSFDASRWTPW